MNILMISTMYPPLVVGGAEIVAQALARWLVTQGHQVSVLAAARSDDGEQWDELVDGVRMFRLALPRSYMAMDSSGQPARAKALWHFQDHFDPRNRRNLARVLDLVQPNFVNVQYLQGLGWNLLEELGERQLPTVITLHDLSLICVNTSRFRNGRACRGICLPCRASTRIKRRFIDGLDRVAFVAPSAAVLDTVCDALEVPGYQRHRLLNPIAYPASARTWTPSGTARLLFVGRLDAQKGTAVALEAAAGLAERYALTLDILGTGPEEHDLRTRYARLPWVRFHGHVTIEAVADAMATADLLLVPSCGPENSPGVIVQALSAGLPVMASDIGGLPELVKEGRNGFLVAPGDVEAWRDALAAVLANPDRLRALRATAGLDAPSFDRDVLGLALVDVFRATMSPGGGAQLVTGDPEYASK